METMKMKMKMNPVRAGVCGGVAFLGLLTLILGISAETSRFQYFGQPTGLGVAAALILAASQITVTICGGCICCSNHGRPELSKGIRMVAIVCFALSWAFFGICFALLFIGALIIASGGFYSPGTMAAGAGLSLLVTGLAITYYLLVTQVTPSNSNSGQPTTFQMGPSAPMEEEYAPSKPRP